ncbi:MAG: hypothetical protein RLZZ78_1697, partial [Armatimonadota bacterium]
AVAFGANDVMPNQDIDPWRLSGGGAYWKWMEGHALFITFWRFEPIQVIGCIHSLPGTTNRTVVEAPAC